MPMIQLPEATYQQVLAQATIRQITVENLAVQLLDPVTQTFGNAQVNNSPQELPYDEWKKLFDDYIAEVQSRSDRYPPGFECDVSRESMYEGCGE